MLKNMSINFKLITLCTVAIVGFFIMSFILYYSINNMKELGDAQSKVTKLEADMLMLRRNEKDFLSRKDMKYKQKFIQNIQIL
jgi:methyl-accepting chemotaxis protein